MYNLLQKMLYHYWTQIIKSYVITFGDEDEFDKMFDTEYNLSDVLDFAYCLAKDYEDFHEKEIKSYHVTK